MSVNALDRETENIDTQKDDSLNKKNELPYDETKFSEKAFKDISSGKLKMHEYLEQQRIKKENAQEKLREATTPDKDGQRLIADTDTHSKFLKKLEAARDPEEFQKIQEELEEFKLKQHEKDKVRAEENQELSPDNPKLQKLSKEFKDACQKNEKYLGKETVSKFEQWIDEQIKRKPTIANAKELLHRLTVEKNADGIVPRKLYYHGTIEPFFQKYGLKPEDSKFIENKGRSKRESFMKQAQNIERHLEIHSGKGFYSPNVVKSIMRDVLESDSLGEQNSIQLQLNNITKKESSIFVELDSTMSVDGVTIKKISKASKKGMIDYYKTIPNLDEREDNLSKMLKFRDDEAKLVLDLKEAFTNKNGEIRDKKMYHEALKEFGDLDFAGRVKSIAEYTTKLDNTEEGEKKAAETLVKGAEKSIERAHSEKIISDKTAKRFLENFDKEKYLDKKTERPDLKYLKEKFDLLENSRPIAEKGKRNLSFYRSARKIYDKDLNKLAEFNKDTDQKYLQKRQEEYDKSTWKEKEFKHMELKKEIKEAEKNFKTREKVEATKEAYGAETKESSETNETVENREQLMKKVGILKAEKRFQAAIDEVMRYVGILQKKLKTDPSAQHELDEMYIELDNLHQLFKHSNGGIIEVDGDKEQEIENTVETIVQNDSEFSKTLDELQADHLATELVEKNRLFEDGEKDAHDRSRSASIDAADDDEEVEAINEFYREIEAHGDKGHIVLDEEGTGTEVISVDVGEKVETSGEELHRLRKDLVEEQDEKLDGGGSEITELKVDGKLTSDQNAADILEEQDEEFADAVAEKSTQTISNREGKGNVIDLVTKRKAYEEAQKVLDQRKQRRIKM